MTLRSSLVAPSVSSSRSIKRSSNAAQNVWHTLASKAQGFFSRTGKSTTRAQSSGKRIKPITTLATIRETRGDEEDEPKKRTPSELVEVEPKPTPRTFLAVDYQSPVGMFHMPRAIGVVLEPVQPTQPVATADRKLRLPSARRVPVPAIDVVKDNILPIQTFVNQHNAQGQRVTKSVGARSQRPRLRNTPSFITPQLPTKTKTLSISRPASRTSRYPVRASAVASNTPSKRILKKAIPASPTPKGRSVTTGLRTKQTQLNCISKPLPAYRALRSKISYTHRPAISINLHPANDSDESSSLDPPASSTDATLTTRSTAMQKPAILRSSYATNHTTRRLGDQQSIPGAPPERDPVVRKRSTPRAVSSSIRKSRSPKRSNGLPASQTPLTKKANISPSDSKMVAPKALTGSGPRAPVSRSRARSPREISAVNAAVSTAPGPGTSFLPILGPVLLMPVDEDARAPKHVKQESLDIRDLLAHGKNVIFPPGSESHNEDVSFMKERPPSDLFDISVELYVIPLHEDTKPRSSCRLHGRTGSQYSLSSVSCRFSVASSVSSGIVTFTPKAKCDWDPFLANGMPITALISQSRLESSSESIYADYAKQWLTDKEWFPGAVLDISAELDSIHGGSALPSSGACSPQVSTPSSCGICSNCLYSNPWSSPSPAMKPTPTRTSRRRGSTLYCTSTAVSLRHTFQEQQQVLFSPSSVRDKVSNTAFSGEDDGISTKRCLLARDIVPDSGGPPGFMQSDSLAGLDLLALGEGPEGGLSESIFDTRLEFSVSERGSWEG